MEENKEFKINKEGVMEVTVKTQSDLTIPHEEKQIKIGMFNQLTTQLIEKDKIKVLQSFIKNQKDVADGQIEKLNDELKKLADVNIDEIPESIIKKCEETINKGSKAFKKQMEILQNDIGNKRKKQQLLQQLEYMKKQVAIINHDFEEISKCI